MIELHLGDCRLVLRSLMPESVDTIITDPPYEIGMLGSAWDKTGGAFDVETWRAALQVARPGAFLLSFGGARTYHRLTCAIEDAGWEIRDCIMWIYGQGRPSGRASLKPGWEPIVVASKPGPRVLNIDAARIDYDPSDLATTIAKNPGRKDKATSSCRGGGPLRQQVVNVAGRWPANLVLDEHAGVELDDQSGIRPGMKSGGKHRVGYPGGMFGGVDSTTTARADTGGASRFFFCAKASRAERGPDNDFPTVKPLSLIRWLCRLTNVPLGGTVLDPFLGSGTTAIASAMEERRFIGVELVEEHLELAKRRIAAQVAA